MAVLEVQAFFARRFCQRHHTTVVLVATPIEDYLLHSGCDGPFGKAGAHRTGDRCLGALFDPGVYGRSGSERVPACIVYHLSIDVVVASEH